RAAAPKARGGPRVALGRQVRCERSGLVAVGPVGEDHEAAVPAGGNLDEITTSCVRTAAADGTVVGWRRGERGKHEKYRSDKLVHFSMTWSARASTDCGIVRPSALAIFRLMSSSNVVGCSTGRSAGLAPLRILSTYVAARRNRSGTCGP